MLFVLGSNKDTVEPVLWFSIKDKQVTQVTGLFKKERRRSTISVAYSCFYVHLIIAFLLHPFLCDIIHIQGLY